MGIGDDAALLAPESRHRVITTDSLCEGTHFILEECGARAVGRKLAGVNLSDLASMAADPQSFFLSLCLPRNSASKIAVEIFEGVFEYASKYQVAIAGGDTNVWDGPLVVHLTAIGLAPETGSWLRSGAKPNDVIVVTGQLGGSILGKHLDVQPRIELSKLIRELEIVNAATDISDGLGIDLLSIASASGCGAEIEMDKIPISQAAVELSHKSGKKPIEHAFGDGEDFELILAVPASKLATLPKNIDGVTLTPIGKFISRTGLWAREGGRVKQVPAKGYTHS